MNRVDAKVVDGSSLEELGFSIVGGSTMEGIMTLAFYKDSGDLVGALELLDGWEISTFEVLAPFAEQEYGANIIQWMKDEYDYLAVPNVVEEDEKDFWGKMGFHPVEGTTNWEWDYEWECVNPEF